MCRSACISRLHLTTYPRVSSNKNGSVRTLCMYKIHKNKCDTCMYVCSVYHWYHIAGNIRASVVNKAASDATHTLYTYQFITSPNSGQVSMASLLTLECGHKDGDMEKCLSFLVNVCCPTSLWTLDTSTRPVVSMSEIDTSDSITITTLRA